MTERTIETLAVGPLETNCYILGCGATGEAAVIDPGGDAGLIKKRLNALKLTPKWILLTHGHGDHIGAVGDLKTAYPELRIAVHEDDSGCLTNPRENLSYAFGLPFKVPAADQTLKEGDEISVGNLLLKVIHIPGHTRGGIAFFLSAIGDEKPVLFSGDTLFAGSVGRGDLPGGDFDLLVKTISEKLLALPDETIVYPGHGLETTIGAEKRSNPYL